MPEELRKMNIVAGKATIEKLLGERAGGKERKGKLRLIREGIKRQYFQARSGPGDVRNFGLYGVLEMCICDICPTENGLWG